MSKIPLRLIYLRTDGCVLTKKKYSGWKEVQDDYDDYMTDNAISGLLRSN